MKRALAALVVIGIAATASAQEDRPLPYWASIASGQAMTRTGPGKNYPAVWLYQRRDLPVKVINRHEHWRLIVDPDGAKGWMLATLLSERRTGMVKPGDPRPLRVSASAGARARYLAEPGVLARIDNCHDGWCAVEVGKNKGYMAAGDLYGVASGEVIDD